MENNEILTNEVTTMEPVAEVYDDYEPSGNGLLGKLLVVGALVTGGAAAVVYKNRDKINEYRIQKLEGKLEKLKAKAVGPELVEDNVVEFEGEVTEE